MKHRKNRDKEIRKNILKKAEQFQKHVYELSIELFNLMKRLSKK